MSQSPANPSRRQALKLFGGAPLLPLGTGISASALLTACGGSGTSATAATTATPTAATFTGMAAPSLSSPGAMATTSVDSSLQVSYSDGSKQAYKLGYQQLFMTGDLVPNLQGGTIVAGGYFDINGKPIVDQSVAGSERQFFSDCPDGTSLLQPIAGADKAKLAVKGNPVFAVAQFEYATRDQSQVSQYGRLPSPIAVLTLDQDPATGKLSLAKYYNVPTKPAYGLWITCGASLSPWNTHLSSEEYEPDAFVAAAGKDVRFTAFINNLYGDANAASDPVKANPYLYGHLPEVKVNADGTGAVVKHFCLGRISHELVQVCPDQRTVLMGDDATNGGAFMFIADKAADLSSGTLYVGQATQTSATGPGAFTLKWIKLGQATSAEIEQLAQATKPTDILDLATTDPQDVTYTKIGYSGKANWVRLKPGMDKAAAFLETHRYAALKGGTLAFTKWEGTTVDAKNKVAYIAMSYIQSTMVDGSVPGFKVQGPKAGATYALNLKGGQTDTSGAAINSDWVPVDMAAPAALIGEDLATPDALGNLANADKIANPDNLKFSEKLRTLFIGEDSGMHVNNFLWAYNVDTKQLARILSTPAGAESTGLQGVDDVNGWTYVLSNFQHPADWETPLHDKVKATLDPLIKANYKDRFGASVGYLTGLPQTAKV
ncbi:MAG: alkaline phosphatase [Thiomonas sp. 20-64-5]|nr:MAG: alkaline phosphatase [Thiomonas sp. 20-64-5]